MRPTTGMMPTSERTVKTSGESDQIYVFSCSLTNTAAPSRGIMLSVVQRG